MTGDTLEQLKRALQAHHRQALEALVDTLIAELESHAQQEGAGRKLLSLKEVCQELGMSKGCLSTDKARADTEHQARAQHQSQARRLRSIPPSTTPRVD